MYNLNCIFKSVLIVDKKDKNDNNDYIEFKNLSSPLSGIWKEDQNRIELKINDTNKKKLIMGFGPSASGKTYNAKTIIKLLNGINTEFPTTFLSIDGGTYRELSIIYQTIITVTKELNIGGVNNLVSTFSLTNMAYGIKTLFDSNIVKRNICNFLIKQQDKGKNSEDKYPGFISLYVPETLGECVTKGKVATMTASCKPLIKTYRNITGDHTEWVALLIWQHKYGKYIDCDFAPKYQCVGCVNSGKSRQETEGKKYSSGSYENSIQYGTKTMNTTQGYRFKIQNLLL